MLSHGYNCTGRGDEPVRVSVTAVIVRFFPAPLSAIKPHDSLLKGLRAAQLHNVDEHLSDASPASPLTHMLPVAVYQ